MFTQGDIVLWWRANPWGPACGTVVEHCGNRLEVLEGERTVRLDLPSFAAEHAPRVVGRVTVEGQPVWATAADEREACARACEARAALAAKHDRGEHSYCAADEASECAADIRRRGLPV